MGCNYYNCYENWENKNLPVAKVAIDMDILSLTFRKGNIGQLNLCAFGYGENWLRNIETFQ